MQTISKVYLQFISLCRLLRDLVPAHGGDAPAETSSVLVYAAVALAILLAILEIDLHHAELVSAGLLSDNSLVEPFFVSP